MASRRRPGAGRKPLPEAVHRARGTRPSGRAAASADAPRIPPSIPDPPHHLDATERRHWHAWIERLELAGLLTVLDGQALGALVSAEVRFERAKRTFEKRGHGAVEINPKTGMTARTAWAKELDAAKADYYRWCVEFGVTPSARTRVRPAAKSDRGKETGRAARVRKIVEGA